MVRLNSCSAVFLVTINLLLFQQVCSLPLGQTILTHEETQQSQEEVNDLPKTYTKAHVEQNGVTKTPVDLSKDSNFKYDVEIIQLHPVTKENDEVEERFRGGPALLTKTNTFAGENIEMDVPKSEGVLKRHFQLAVILGVAGLSSIILYGLLLVWRSHYQQRYGMRELLLATGNDFYEPNNNPNNNNPTSSSSSVYNTTTQKLVLG